MKNCQPKRVSRTLTSSTEEKNLVNPNVGQTQFLQKFDILGFSRLQEHLTIASTVQSLVACFSKLDRWHKHKQHAESFLQKEAEFLCNIDGLFDIFFFVVWQGIHDPGQTQEKDWGRGFIFLPLQLAALPRSGVGSDGFEQAPCFVIQNCQTHHSSRCLLCESY